MTEKQKTTIDWKYVVLFVLLALGLSYPVQAGYLDELFLSVAKESFLARSSYLMAALSTVLAASILFILHRRLSDTITLFGDDAAKNTLVACLPIIAFSIIGLSNDFGMNKNLNGFLFTLVNTLYAFGEEIGWRRYLQNALEGLNRHLKYILIGFVWWVWHFRFDTSFDVYLFPLICIGGGYLLGKLADDTRSILPVVAMHTLIIVTTNAGHFGQREMLGIGCVVVGWTVIERIWKGRAKQDNSPM